MSRIGRCIMCIILVLGLGVLVMYEDVSGGMVKLRTNLCGDPVLLDCATMRTFQDRTIVTNIYEGLLVFDVEQEPPYPLVPVLAKNWEISEDAKSLTFELRKGVQFHHGYGELTSEDVVFSMNRHKDPQLASRAKTHHEDVERVEALGKYKVRFHLKRPSAYSFARNLGMLIPGSITSKKAVQELGDLNQFPIGTGPLYFDRMEPGEKVVLKKFDKYWGEPAKIDEVELWIIPEEVVALGALQKGDLDIVTLAQPGTFKMAKKLVESGKVDFRLQASTAETFLFVLYPNHKKKPINDIRVRRALAHALDIKGICSRIGELAVAHPSPFPPAVFAATDEFWTYEYDIKKAKRLLEEAGYPNGFELHVIYKKASLYEPIILEVKNSWDKIVDVKLEVIDSALLRKRIKEGKQHVAHWGYGRISPYQVAARYMTGNPQNYEHYSNPEMDELINKAIVAPTEEEQRRLWREFQKKACEEVVTIVVAVGKNYFAVKNNLKGVVLWPFPQLLTLGKAYFE
jgi:peptide/nickel transport system substrate-binding protein